MWFRNLRFYRLTAPLELDPEQIAAAIKGQTFRPCGSLELSSYGWVPPLGRHTSALTHAAGGCVLLCARREEKVLPSSVVREQVEERVAAIEEAEARKVGRKQRREMTDELTFELLPRALTRSARTYAYIDLKGGWVVVDAASQKKAEELLSLLREGLGSLPTRLPETTDNPVTIMTRWLAGELPSGAFAPLDECELREPGEDGGVVRLRRQDLGADEVRHHLEAGKQVTRLAVAWGERLRAVIEADLTIKRLRFEDVVVEELENIGSEDEAALFDAQFALMTLELARFLPALLEAFGGENRAAY